MTDQYAWWRQALKLAGDCRELTRDQLALLSVSEDSPESGFFRNRPFKDLPLVPVAIWRDTTGNIICLQGGEEADALRLWSHVCRNPITEALYHSVLAGGAWPDEPPAVSKEHNLPAKTGDLHADLTVELAAEKEIAEAFLKKTITTQEQADQAGIWAKRLAVIANKATEQFNVEKRPWIDGGNAIDDKWRDLRTDSSNLVKKLKKHGEAWLVEQQRLEDERQRKAREDADRIRREAEAAALRAAEAARAAEEEHARREADTSPGIATTFAQDSEQEAERLEAEQEAKRLERLAADAEREARARPVFAGRTGAKMSLRTTFAARIVDYDKALLALKDHPEMKALVEQLANRAVKAGLELAGVEKVEQRNAA